MFQKVFEYAGPHKKGLYAATAIVLVSVLMGVLPFVLAYQVIAPLVMGESIGASFIISRVALVLACLVLQALFYAFSLIVNLIQKAEKEIVLIDGYVDVGTLNLLAKKNENVSVVMYTLKRTKLSQGDVDNFNSQYPSLEVRYTKVFHDRFLILDKKNAYHIGASLKDAGKKCFGITLLEDDGIVRDILQRLELETEE